jgi:hypothetical protein
MVKDRFYPVATDIYEPNSWRFEDSYWSMPNAPYNLGFLDSSMSIIANISGLDIDA